MQTEIMIAFAIHYVVVAFLMVVTELLEADQPQVGRVHIMFFEQMNR